MYETTRCLSRFEWLCARIGSKKHVSAKAVNFPLSTGCRWPWNRSSTILRDWGFGGGRLNGLSVRRSGLPGTNRMGSGFRNDRARFALQRFHRWIPRRSRGWIPQPRSKSLLSESERRCACSVIPAKPCPRRSAEITRLSPFLEWQSNRVQTLS